MSARGINLPVFAPFSSRWLGRSGEKAKGNSQLSFCVGGFRVGRRNWGIVVKSWGMTSWCGEMLWRGGIAAEIDVRNGSVSVFL